MQQWLQHWNNTSTHFMHDSGSEKACWQSRERIIRCLRWSQPNMVSPWPAKRGWRWSWERPQRQCWCPGAAGAGQWGAESGSRSICGLLLSLFLPILAWLSSPTHRDSSLTPYLPPVLDPQSRQLTLPFNSNLWIGRFSFQFKLFFFSFCQVFLCCIFYRLPLRARSCPRSTPPLSAWDFWPSLPCLAASIWKSKKDLN